MYSSWKDICVLEDWIFNNIMFLFKDFDDVNIKLLKLIIQS